MAQTNTKNIGYLRVRKGCNRSLTNDEVREAEKFHRKVSHIPEDEMIKRFTI